MKKKQLNLFQQIFFKFCKWIVLNMKFTLSITNYLRTPNKHL